jgi:hypothetical protein
MYFKMELLIENSIINIFIKLVGFKSCILNWIQMILEQLFRTKYYYICVYILKT